MKHFTDGSKVYGFDDGDAIPLGLAPVSDAELPGLLDSIRANRLNEMTGEQRSEEMRRTARRALAASDITVLRFFESGAKLPAAWKQYREDLRSIIRAADGDPTATALPERPEYPPST